MAEHILPTHINELNDLLSRVTALRHQLAEAGSLMARVLLNEGKVLHCGEGASKLLAQYFNLCLIDRFERDRPGLPSICLSDNVQLAENQDNQQVLAKSVRALGEAGDLLVLICNNKSSESVKEAIKAAHQRNISIIALTALGDTEVTHLIAAEDMEIKIPANRIARIHEAHLLVIHSLCDLIDHQLFGGNHES